MNANEMFPPKASKYLKASDLNGKAVNVVIDRVAIETMGQGKDQEQKPVLYFQGKEKGLVLNRTNNRSIMNLYGWETDSWKGKPITLYTIMTEMGGQPTLGIRILAPGQIAPAPPPPPPREPGADDDVDF